MFERLSQILGGEKTAPGPATSPEERTQIAAAVILLEAAHIDDECTTEEIEHVLETLKTRFALSRESAAELSELAHDEKSRALDLWQFTNRINESFTRDEKLAILEGVWRIIHADGRLDKHEDHFVRKLTVLLRLSHREMIDVKIRARSPA